VHVEKIMKINKCKNLVFILKIKHKRGIPILPIFTFPARFNDTCPTV
jgi:hypothetical protein